MYNNPTHRRTLFLFVMFAGMMAALFFSRAMLSICMAMFVLGSFLHDDIKKHLHNFFSSPLLWSMSVLFVLPLVSGLWSEDKGEWLRSLRIKLPLFLLPLAFAGPFTFTTKQWNRLAYFFIILVIAGSAWSLVQYAGNMKAINESYLRAKSIATVLGNDHIRFSWLVSMAVLLSFWMWWKARKQSKWLAWLLLLTVIWLIIFLHLLAARTGLLSLYVMLLVTGGWLLWKKAKPLPGIGLILILIISPLIAYYTFPSFQNRVKYIFYDYTYFKDDHYLAGGNDAARVISLRAGWNLLLQNPLAGLGSGDIYGETKKWAQARYPGILDADILYPSSEWLIYGLISGWAGVVLFTGIMLIPFFTRGRPSLVWLLLNLTAALSFLFDIGLEVQFGVFAYSFTVLWWWKWLEPQKEITLSDD